jgi:hypothetical protein
MMMMQGGYIKMEWVATFIGICREKQFTEEDGAWRRKKQTTLALFVGLIGLIFLFIFTIMYRLIAKEIERRAKIREEELKRMNDNPTSD